MEVMTIVRIIQVVATSQATFQIPDLSVHHQVVVRHHRLLRYQQDGETSEVLEDRLPHHHQLRVIQVVSLFSAHRRSAGFPRRPGRRAQPAG